MRLCGGGKPVGKVILDHGEIHFRPMGKAF